MKKLLSLAISLLIAVSICGCGDSKKNESPAPEKNEPVKESTKEPEKTKNNNKKNTENSASDTGTKKKEKNPVSEEDHEKKEKETSSNTIKETPVTEHTKTFFNSIPSTFTYENGDGNKKTELKFKEDGTFTGKFTFPAKEEKGDGYSEGTVYICNFSGKFSEPIPMDKFMYVSSVERLETEKNKDETYIENNIRYVVSSPEGLEKTKEVVFFIPGATTAVFPPGTLDAVKNKDSIGANLPEGIFILRSFADSSTFVAYEN